MHRKDIKLNFFSNCMGEQFTLAKISLLDSCDISEDADLSMIGPDVHCAAHRQRLLLNV